MCLCKGIEFGSYEVTIPVWYDERRRVVGLDVCIALEVISLWKQGIVTIESCCGHNKISGYIAVEECCVDKMVALGYTEYADKPTCFYPKKLLNEVKRKDFTGNCDIGEFPLLCVYRHHNDCRGCMHFIV